MGDCSCRLAEKLVPEAVAEVAAEKRAHPWSSELHERQPSEER